MKNHARSNEDHKKHLDSLQPESTMNWYEMCCDKTLNKARAGVIPGGVVSSSGYGDGGYSCHVVKNRQDKVVAVKIIFIGDKADEDDADEDNESQD